MNDAAACLMTLAQYQSTQPVTSFDSATGDLVGQKGIAGAVGWTCPGFVEGEGLGSRYLK